MITTTKISGKDIYRISMQGTIDKEDIENFYNLLIENSQQNETVKILLIVREFPSFSDFTAFAEIVKVKLAALALKSKFAIISDKEWLQKIIQLGNFLTPNALLKYFSPEEEEEAIAWLEEKNGIM